MQAAYPNETLAVDIVGPMHESSEGNMWMLTMIDQFTRWPVAVPLPEITSKTIADAIFRYWIVRKGSQ